MKTVFVVDDGDFNLVLAENALENHYNVLTFPSAAKMFAFMNKVMPSLILLDIEMPEMDGFAALEKLKRDEQHSKIPIIFITATVTEDIKARGSKLGVVDFIEKPFSESVLLDCVASRLFTAKSEAETLNWASSFAKKLKAGDVVALEGDLGAGKTTVCKGICKSLGFTGVVNSPSYSIVHEYPNDPPIYHLDLYRLKNATDLCDIGIENFTFSKGITLIEWPQMAGDFPLNITHRIEIKIIGENERDIFVVATPRGCPYRNIFISLGTNIEPRSERLSQARELLKAEEPYGWIESKVYETEPWGEPNQAKFLNQVVGFNSNKTPHELLNLCKSIEEKMGRQKREKWKEREIDLDLLYCGDCIIKDENLTLPHTHIAQREFVLSPLCDIAPEFVDPRSKLTVKEMLASLNH